MFGPLQKYFEPGFVLHSRVHPSNVLFPDAKLYIKREDELSSGIAGCKYRKFASLLPYIKMQGFSEVLVIGSAQSNNVVAALQLFIENQIPCRLLLLESNEETLKGNLLWMSMLLDMADVIWVTRNDWENVNQIALKYQTDNQVQGKRVFILPEGAAVDQVLPGTMSLAYDILENEEELGIVFDHVFMDSGTGTSAMGLIFGMKQLGKQCKTHITLIAGTRDSFIGSLKYQFKETRGSNVDNDISDILSNTVFHEPISAKSFGSVTTTILQALKSIAREEGIIMDPVYSVKHYMTAINVIETQKLSGNILFVYNGGSFAVSGYQDKLSKLF
jgi:1-aminocyclopropane-1-carboxylate deaminase